MYPIHIAIKLFTIVFTLINLSFNSKASDLKKCEWDNRKGIPCITISKTPNTAGRNASRLRRKSLKFEQKSGPTRGAGGEKRNYSYPKARARMANRRN